MLGLTGWRIDGRAGCGALLVCVVAGGCNAAESENEVGDTDGSSTGEPSVTECVAALEALECVGALQPAFSLEPEDVATLTFVELEGGRHFPAFEPGAESWAYIDPMVVYDGCVVGCVLPVATGAPACVSECGSVFGTPDEATCVSFLAGLDESC